MCKNVRLKHDAVPRLFNPNEYTGPIVSENFLESMDVSSSINIVANQDKSQQSDPELSDNHDKVIQDTDEYNYVESITSGKAIPKDSSYASVIEVGDVLNDSTKSESDSLFDDSSKNSTVRQRSGLSSILNVDL
ncbi:uncharacterized protein LOC106640745 [Copidosoma floridanum]|uniref:uncharacterized protein LOC106640745 n=1 Tax=Copidosoma floridanum TaxID=29053 RepID=UPI0006C94775|nr:uncharacterized protein LOC106640745 [Copidosoma floridanum]